MRLLGRFQVPGCCPGTRAGKKPGPDCSGGGSMTARYRKRQEFCDLRRELEVELLDLKPPETGSLHDPSDCMHGCNGDSPCGTGCNFTCHQSYLV